MTRKPKRPADMNKLAKSIVDIATGEDSDSTPNTQPRGRSGGLDGGRARAENLSAKRRKEIAEKAAKARWLKNAAPSSKECS